MKKLHPLPLTLITTTLVSGVALVYAWTGPTAAPYNNNTAIPVNVGSAGQTKSGSFTSTGLGSAGNLIVTGNTTLGAGTAPRAALDVNGTIITNAGYAQKSTTWYDILGDRIGAARSLYSYGSLCTSTAAGDCTGAGGIVIGGANTSANVNITNTGNIFFNTAGNVGFGTNAPTQAPVVIRAPAALADGSSSLSFLRSGGNTYGYVYGSGGNGMIRMQHEGGSTYTEIGARFGSALAQLVSNNSRLLRFGSSTATTWSIGNQAGSNDLRFDKDGSSPVMAINYTSGNVGIGGTTTPSSKLTVIGSIQSTSGGFTFPDGTTQTTAAGGAGNYIQNQVAAGQLASAWVTGSLKANSGIVGSGAGGDSWLQYTNGNNYLRGNTYFNGVLYDEGNSAYYIDPQNTSIYNDLRSSIWYDRDNTSFYIDGNGMSNLSGVQSSIFVNNSSDPYFRTDANNKWIVLSGGSGWANTGATMVLRGSASPANPHGLEMYTGGNESLRILSNGNVGINNTSPSYKLDVAGQIRSSSGGYVFPDGTVQTTAAGGSGSYIQNQYSAAQSANAWVSGILRAQGGILSQGSGGDTWLQTGGANYLRGNTYFNGTLYDESNTSFYLKPSATSVLNTLRADGEIQVGSGGATFRAVNGGNVGINATSPIRALQVNGEVSITRSDKNAFINVSDNSGNGSGTIWLRGLTSGGSAQANAVVQVVGTLNVSSSVTATAFYYSSDSRLKNNLAPIDDSLSKIRALQGYTFNWKDGGRADVGVVAQEVEKVFPELVKTDAKGYKSVEYGNLVAPIIEAVKELANKFDALATRMFNVENRVTNLEKQNELQAQQIAELQKQINELKNK